MSESKGMVVGGKFAILLLGGLAIFVLLSYRDGLGEMESLPPETLEFYCDRFDTFREDLWEKAGHVFSREQLRNYKPVRMDLAEGKLVMETETGCFSKGGLISKYALRGDFDIQMDCETVFSKDMVRMDHVLSLIVLNNATETESMFSLALQVIKKSGWRTPRVFTGYRRDERYHAVTKEDIKHEFTGSLRITREEDTFSTMYKLQGMRDWRRLGKVRLTGDDVYVAVALQNFVSKRRSINASTPVRAAIDSFRIHSAREILESEI